MTDIPGVTDLSSPQTTPADDPTGFTPANPHTPDKSSDGESGKTAKTKVFTTQVEADSFINFREQCWLVKNMDVLTAFDDRYELRYSKYKHFTPVTGDPFRVVGAFTNMADNAELLSMTPEQISYLIPTIRLFKVGTFKMQREEGEAAVEQRSEQLGEYTFKDFTDLSHKHVKKMLFHEKMPDLRGLGHGSSVGLRRFTYEYDGGNPELPKMGMMHIKLEFFFTDVRLLFEPISPGSNLSYIDLITYKPAALQGAGAGTVKCGDKDIPLTEFYDENEFGIKLVFGWESPTKFPHASARLKKALKNSRTTLLLNLLRHTFDYADDGTVVLTIEYIGRSETMARTKDSNIFWIPGALEAEYKLKQARIKEATKKLMIVRNDPTIKAMFGPQARKQEIEEAERQKKLATQEAEVFQVRNKRHVYKRLMDYLWHEDMIWRIWVNPQDVAAYDASTKKINTQINTSPNPPADEMSDIMWTGGNRGAIEQPQSNQSGQQSAPQENVANIVTAIEEAQDSADLSRADALQQATHGTLESLKTIKTFDQAVRNNTNYAIKFFYLGDLIQAALAIIAGYDPIPAYDQTKVRKINRQHEIKLMLGPVIFETTTANGKTAQKRKNLADLPIALNEYISWFNQEVVSNLLDTWTLDTFLTAVLSRFFPKILGEDCISPDNEAILNTSPKLTIVPLDLPKSLKGKKRSGSIPSPRNGHNKPRHYLNFFRRDGDGTARPYNLSTLHPWEIDQVLYVYWYAYDRTKIFKGDEKEDREKHSIYHYYMGADRGLVKNIKFKRNDMPGLVEGRIVSENCRSLQLREVYDTTIQLFGNPLVKPGQYIYVTPSPFLGRNAYGRMLGMTGYYYVTKVRGEMSPGSFETTVDGWWQQYATLGDKATTGQTSVEIIELAGDTLGAIQEIDPSEAGRPQTPLEAAAEDFEKHLDANPYLY